MYTAPPTPYTHITRVDHVSSQVIAISFSFHRRELENSKYYYLYSLAKTLYGYVFCDLF